VNGGIVRHLCAIGFWELFHQFRKNAIWEMKDVSEKGKQNEENIWIAEFPSGFLSVHGFEFGIIRLEKMEMDGDVDLLSGIRIIIFPFEVIDSFLFDGLNHT